jgi:hypothetical protein
MLESRQGYERFRVSGRIQFAATFILASETHKQKNVNGSVAEQLEREVLNRTLSGRVYRVRLGVRERNESHGRKDA